jgi:hypothetical protein
MSGNIDIFLRQPDVAAIGRAKLQDYCDQWLQRPIAQDFGVSHLIVGSDLLLTLNLDPQRAKLVNNRTYVPIEELLDYVIDTHFQDATKRRELHSEARDIRKHWGEVGYQYWTKCKNPSCGIELESAQQAVDGQRIHCPPSSLTCPECRYTAMYDGNDLWVKV